MTKDDGRARSTVPRGSTLSIVKRECVHVAGDHFAPHLLCRSLAKIGFDSVEKFEINPRKTIISGRQLYRTQVVHQRPEKTVDDLSKLLLHCVLATLFTTAFENNGKYAVFSCLEEDELIIR
uniref:Uncharacterized protein n=1 Tax=Coccidioides posadasii RMSCC 3488 TaxID=454284 RepID=A0A0J6F1B8_COCPO|nr:hypothetical protein CPAG_02985 [Coccidioides posadasii RMSCC 3488]